eukprot:4325576-Amphidinium_carterae.1
MCIRDSFVAVNGFGSASAGKLKSLGSALMHHQRGSPPSPTRFQCLWLLLLMPQHYGWQAAAPVRFMIKVGLIFSCKPTVAYCLPNSCDSLRSPKQRCHAKRATTETMLEWFH